MPDYLTRPVPPWPGLPLLSRDAGLLARFTPPFEFTSFFSPEDTLLCALAVRDALGDSATDARLRVVELTSGSGLVGLSAIKRTPDATLLGADVDPLAAPIARANARRLGLADRSRFETASLWDEALGERLGGTGLLVCNPPYIPEPPGHALAREAGSGPDGAAHLRRVVELACLTRPPRLVLSWCSVSDPAGIVRDAERAGYRLEHLLVAAIADGEYSGSVQSYLESLPTAFIATDAASVRAVAPDGAARFAYLLMAGVFADAGASASMGASVPDDASDAADAIDRIMEHFRSGGVATLPDAAWPVPTRAWLCDRWDEIVLRALLHGPLPAARRGGGRASAVPA